MSKNYLAEGEARELNRLTKILLDIFEDQADLGRLVVMADSTRLLDAAPGPRPHGVAQRWLGGTPRRGGAC